MQVLDAELMKEILTVRSAGQGLPLEDTEKLVSASSGRLFMAKLLQCSDEDEFKLRTKDVRNHCDRYKALQRCVRKALAEVITTLNYRQAALTSDLKKQAANAENARKKEEEARTRRVATLRRAVEKKSMLGLFALSGKSVNPIDVFADMVEATTEMKSSGKIAGAAPYLIKASTHGLQQLLRSPACVRMLGIFRQQFVQDAERRDGKTSCLFSGQSKWPGA